MEGSVKQATHAATPPRLRDRFREISPATFRTLAFLALGSLFLVVVTGAVVRLTASGLGCDNWPRCGDTPLPEKDFHALVEFGNRVVALGAIALATVAALAARRVRDLPRWIVWTAAFVAIAIIGQIPLGGITVITELHPLAVMSHFLLAMVTVAASVLIALGAHTFLVGAPPRDVPRELGWLAISLVPVVTAMVVTGAFVTAAGPHSGGADIERLGNLEDALYVHVRAAAVYGIGFLGLVVALLALRRRPRSELMLAGGLLLVLVVQMIIGEVQWRNQLPWELVLVHVALATAVLGAAVALAGRLMQRSAPISLQQAFRRR